MGLLFLLFPVLELLTLFWLGRTLGVGPTFIYLLGTFFVGVNLIRSAGFNSLKMASPGVVLEAPFRLMAGILILIPGLISDGLAVLILIPFVRKALWLYFFSRVFRGRFYQQTWSSGGSSYNYRREDIVDVPFMREERDVTPQSQDKLPLSDHSQ